MTKKKSKPIALPQPNYSELALKLQADGVNQSLGIERSKLAQYTDHLYKEREQSKLLVNKYKGALNIANVCNIIMALAVAGLSFALIHKLF